MLVQKKRSKEKDAFFKEYFGEKAKNRGKNPAERRSKKSPLLDLEVFSTYSSKKGRKLLKGNW
ncbi:hypothetical protein C7S20_00165 [Christiangramia fulva]|uniref:Uncharacterized protein n=1 Tax=Christiangramia fulva TaxID=2126553 RepID=A0A2R3Z0L8_9FLAO|nr:hypothetical protein C7S20_00165 [Christiangramia fulva]